MGRLLVNIAGGDLVWRAQRVDYFRLGLRVHANFPRLLFELSRGFNIDISVLDVAQLGRISFIFALKWVHVLVVISVIDAYSFWIECEFEIRWELIAEFQINIVRFLL